MMENCFRNVQNIRKNVYDIISLIYYAIKAEKQLRGVIPMRNTQRSVSTQFHERLNNNRRKKLCFKITLFETRRLFYSWTVCPKIHLWKNSFIEFLDLFIEKFIY